LHLFPSLWRLGSLSFSEKRQLARGLGKLARTNPAQCGDETFLRWLDRHGQSPTVIERFWHVVLVSALSETLDRIDIAHARKVFVDAFLANRRGWEVWLPTVPLSDLYGRRLEEWFTRRNVVMRRQCGVKRVLIENQAQGETARTRAARATGVELRSGDLLEADHVVLAVPQYLVLSLFSDEWRATSEFAELGAAIERLETAPISSVHLWFDRPITDLRHAVLVGRLSQWIFNRSAIQGGGGNQEAPRTSTNPPYPPLRRGGDDEGQLPRGSDDARLAGRGDEGQRAGGGDEGESGNSEIRPVLNWTGPKSEIFYYQVVISASREVLERGHDETIRAVVEELAGIWPVVREARLVHARLVTEHKAVISMLPGVDRLRPVQQSPIGNLQLAGDWTQTGWPGTMEGAVRSGYLAAENVLRQCGRAETLVRPDLPRALLSKLLFGL
jgi:hypothetical protein